MSHFTVLVIGDDYEKQLAPFQENNMRDCPKEYLEFHDVEDEYRKEYEDDGVEMIVMPDGELVHTWDDRFKVGGILDRKVVIPEGLEKRHVPHKERYSSFDEFIQGWAGYKERHPDTGRYGYWENPNKKWDWYEVGGRWTGFFKVVEKPQYPNDIALGRAGLMTEPAEVGHADRIRKCDIDIEGMQAEARQKANEYFGKLEAATKDCPPPFTWEETRANYPDLDQARQFYHAQAFVKALQKADIYDFFGDQVAQFRDGREKYVERRVRSVMLPFAVVHDGKWYEKGSMGWWGCVSNETDDDEWGRQFFELFESLPPDTTLTLVDCHI